MVPSRRDNARDDREVETRVARIIKTVLFFIARFSPFFLFFSRSSLPEMFFHYLMELRFLRGLPFCGSRKDDFISLHGDDWVYLLWMLLSMRKDEIVSLQSDLWEVFFFLVGKHVWDY
ncbi:hypothetical protein CEXT_24041 [Caerostris extrusa]|uniref:Uncharacterized protein n=1 Tax=Caerostris extrusa TaxID=172846 RepID=A0AAV4SKG9_CAEEX|nr:hypothetical protein CEXT_24041 [Caerostris extrusa]